jgi:hypothetical protein
METEMPMNDPQSDAAQYEAEIDAMLADLEEQIQAGPSEEDAKAEAEDACRAFDSL